LAIVDSTKGSHFHTFDGNGNVATLTSTDYGTNTAQYHYSPFGEVIRATGPMAKANTFQFSSKCHDDETDLLYYGFRYYRPSMGEWASRDLSGETSGRNLYGFLGNDAVIMVDYLGLWPSANRFLGVTFPTPLTHQNSIKRTIPKWAHATLFKATVEVDTRQELEASYMHAMRAPWQTTGYAHQSANDFVRRSLVRTRELLDHYSLNAALESFGEALHTIQDATSPAHFGFQKWLGEDVLIEAVDHVRRETFDPGPNSELDKATSWFWCFFSTGPDAPVLPFDFFNNLGHDDKK